MNSPRSYSMTNRSARAEATRHRIVDAATELFLAHAYGDVTLAAIAASAGVSHQTVLNHFESKAGVVAGVAAHLRDQTTTTRTAPPGDVAGAVAALVEDYERMGDANVRWAVEDLDEIRPFLDEARASHQDWLVAVFGADLPGDPAARRRSVHALHAATDVYTWKLLRRDLRLSRSETETTIADLVVGILQGAPS